MKALILNCPKVDHIDFDTERFSEMIKALDVAGIDGKYYDFHSREQLECLLFMEHPDIVYCADYYTKDESLNRISVHSVLDELNISYIGSNSDTLEFVLSKSDLKLMWRLNNLPTPSFFQVHQTGSKVFGLETLIQATDYPYILKPDREGNSRGLDESSIVFDQESLELKLEDMLKLYEEILIEKYLGNFSDIREFTVAMIGNDNHKLLMPAEITLKQNKKLRIITTEDKETHKTQALPISDFELSMKIIKLAEKAFKVAGVRDYARCDLILADGHLYAIEINGQPMIPDKWFEVCASGIGLDSKQYINAIFLAGLVRNIKEGKEHLIVPNQMRLNLPLAIFDALQIR